MERFLDVLLRSEADDQVSEAHRHLLLLRVLGLAVHLDVVSFLHLLRQLFWKL